MTNQYDTNLRNTLCDAYESNIGTTPTLELRSGAPPANCAAADSGTLLATGTLPSDWLNAASSGSKTIIGTYSLTGQSGAGSGTNVGHFRLKTSGGTCKHQGTVTVTGGGGDMTMNNINVANGQAVTVNAFTVTMPGA